LNYRRDAREKSELARGESEYGKVAAQCGNKDVTWMVTVILDREIQLKNWSEQFFGLARKSEIWKLPWVLLPPPV
jgi:hypothetical protein